MDPPKRVVFIVGLSIITRIAVLYKHSIKRSFGRNAGQWILVIQADQNTVWLPRQRKFVRWLWKTKNGQGEQPTNDDEDEGHNFFRRRRRERTQQTTTKRGFDLSVGHQEQQLQQLSR